jgi:hypothetical protein
VGIDSLSRQVLSTAELTLRPRIQHTDAEKVSPVVQLGGAKTKVILHVHDEVHDLVEAAGTRAVRRKSVESKKLR